MASWPRIPSQHILLVTRLIAATVLGAEIVLRTMRARSYDIPYFDYLLPLAGLLGVLCLQNGQLPLLGLRLSPNKGWLYWCRFTLWTGLILGALLLAAVGIVWLSTGKMELRHMPRAPLSIDAILWACVHAPLYEEVLYRALLTVAVFPLLGFRGTIIAGGLIFGLAHILGGNPGLDNQVAGFILGWAFLRGGSILVPMAMHATGNLCALLAQAAAYHWLPLVPSNA